MTMNESRKWRMLIVIVIAMVCLTVLGVVRENNKLELKQTILELEREQKRPTKLWEKKQ